MVPLGLTGIRDHSESKYPRFLKLNFAENSCIAVNILDKYSAELVMPEQSNMLPDMKSQFKFSLGEVMDGPFGKQL